MQPRFYDDLSLLKKYGLSVYARDKTAAQVTGGSRWNFSTEYLEKGETISEGIAGAN